MNQESVDLKVETITPLHVGSGAILLRGRDYVAAGKQWAVIDESRVFDLLGESHLQNWMEAIATGQDIAELIRGVKPGFSPSEIARRLITVRESNDQVRELREQLHDGRGRPFVPGSSIKGAIRTAWFATEVMNRRSEPFFQQRENFLNQGGHLKDAAITKRIMGKDPNHDLFRLLRIGDCYFNGTVVLLAQTLNQQGNGSKAVYKHTIRQHLECIDAGQKGVCRLQIASRLGELAMKYGELPASSEIRLNSLFKRINDNTLELLNYEEIDRWKDVELPDEAAGFTEQLTDIRKLVERAGERECYLRMAFGSGFHWMTGAWQNAVFQNATESLYDTLNDAVRGHRYARFDLPKTRKVVRNEIPLGFVRLSY